MLFLFNLNPNFKNEKINFTVTNNNWDGIYFSEKK